MEIELLIWIENAVPTELEWIANFKGSSTQIESEVCFRMILNEQNCGIRFLKMNAEGKNST